MVHIHKSLRPDRKGELVMLDTDEERTLFFDFSPLELGQVEGFSVRFNMYTVPGQTYYEASRKLVLDSADGVVFVVDSKVLGANALLTLVSDASTNIGNLRYQLKKRVSRDRGCSLRMENGRGSF